MCVLVRRTFVDGTKSASDSNTGVEKSDGSVAVFLVLQLALAA